MIPDRTMWHSDFFTGLRRSRAVNSTSLDLGSFQRWGKRSRTLEAGWRCTRIKTSAECVVDRVYVWFSQHATSACGSGRFLRFATIAPDNNIAEAGLRRVALGRKNFPLSEAKTPNHLRRPLVHTRPLSIPRRPATTACRYREPCHGVTARRLVGDALLDVGIARAVPRGVRKRARVLAATPRPRHCR